MKKVKCMLDKVNYSEKPQGVEIAKITNRLANSQVEIEIDELAEKLIKGHTFKPAVVGKKEAEWMEQILFALDFDENTTIDEELNRCKELNILPIFAYTSFSHQENHHKFRLVFCANEITTDYTIAKSLQLALMNAFSNCDEKCKNISRLFFGGKNIVYANYENIINYKEIIEKYKSINTEKKSNSKMNDVEEGFSPQDNIDNTNTFNIMWGKTPSAENTNNYYNLKALRDRNVEYLKNKIGNPKIILENNQAFFNYIKGYDLGDLLDIKYPNSFRCVLHEDNKPSAGIFVNEEGTYIYHCFSCGVSYNIINLIEVLCNFKSRPKAYKFMREIFNIEIQETEWQKEQKEIIEANLRALDMGELEKECPITYKNISRNIKYLRQLLYIAKDNVYSENLTDNEDNVIFFASNKFICDKLGMSCNSAIEVTKKNALFVYHYLLNKLDDKDIPEDILKKSQAISANSGNRHQKRVSYYSFPSYSTLLFKDIEEQGQKWIDNNYSMTGISREMFYRVEGSEIANKLYPQHKQVVENKQIVNRTTTSKSNERTDEIVKIIFSILEIQPYVAEKYIVDELSASGDVKTSKKESEKQLKKSLQEILLTYNLQRVRCNKEIKKLYNVDSEGYPFIIVKNVE
jgi:hypothetical protein